MLKVLNVNLQNWEPDSSIERFYFIFFSVKTICVGLAAQTASHLSLKPHSVGFFFWSPKMIVFKIAVSKLSPQGRKATVLLSGGKDGLVFLLKKKKPKLFPRKCPANIFPLPPGRLVWFLCRRCTRWWSFSYQQSPKTVLQQTQEKDFICVKFLFQTPRVQLSAALLGFVLF